MASALGLVALLLIVGGFVGALILVSAPKQKWLSRAVAGALAFQAIYLVLLARERDTYYDPQHVTRWEFAAMNGGRWIVVVAMAAALAAAAGLLVGIRRPASTAAAISFVLVLLASFVLTVGH